MHALLEEARLAISEIEDGSDDDSLVGAETDSEVEDVLEDLATCVQCLVDLGPSLEHPARDREFEETAREVSEDTRACFYTFCGMIEQRFPRAASTLVERLGKLNWDI